jgi:DNA-binding SARP family transcriptional activator
MLEPLTIRLFGPFEACVDGAPLPRLLSRKGQQLLALLTLRAGCCVERAWLAGVLWSDSAEEHALRSLRTSLWDLRRALGPEASRLHSPTLHTLALDLSSAHADVVAFDAALARGELASLEGAVALYRGPLLEGWSEEWVFPERQAREQAYLAALERLAAQALERGDAATGERYLRQAVATDPLRESAQRALMEALAGGGNDAAALLVYRELRLLLHRELNAAPDPETTALFQSLRAREAPVDRRYRTAPASGARDRRHNLPLQLTSFIGREREMAQVKGLLATERLVTLTGAGGCGKTRLALQVAGDLVESVVGGVRLAELAPLAEPALVPQALASALGVREEPGQTLMATLPSGWWCWTTASIWWRGAPGWQRCCCRAAPGCGSWRPAGRRSASRGRAATASRRSPCRMCASFPRWNGWRSVRRCASSWSGRRR